MKTAKNGGFREELLSENDFEAVLINFCCYEYISTRTLLELCQLTKQLISWLHLWKKIFSSLLPAY